jgi:uncharacterized protein YndB with AHSA1/START domain
MTLRNPVAVRNEFTRVSNTSMVRREHDGVWVTLKETIAAAPEEVFACFSTPEGLTRWLAVGAEMNAEPGGTITLAWDRTFDRTLTVRIREYEPGSLRIGFDWFPDPLSEESVPVHVVVTPEVGGGTRVIMRQGPFREDVDALIAMADGAESWRWYLCNLRSVLETRHDMRSVRPL